MREDALEAERVVLRLEDRREHEPAEERGPVKSATPATRETGVTGCTTTAVDAQEGRTPPLVLAHFARDWGPK